MRFHVVSLPHTQTTTDYVHCAYTEKVRKFCDMMKSLGHEVLLYASEDNEADCDELITCITQKEQKELIGIEKPTDNGKVKFDLNEPYWQLMNQRVIEEIEKRKQPKDFICVIAGLCQKPIADAFPDLMTVEFGIGYEGVFSEYRVFESYAWMHAVYGKLYGANDANGHAFDTVIPNYYDIADFPFGAKKEDYFLYIGRLTDRKGYQIAVDVCQRLGERLLIAGQGEPPEYGEYVGVVDAERRGELMSKAKAVFVPTQYLEPFGGVHAEALLCGTPVITSDWGVFPESVKNGFNGYRCRVLQDYIDAVDKVGGLDYGLIQEDAIRRFDMDTVRYMYQDYFTRLLTLWDDGWYQTK